MRFPGSTMTLVATLLLCAGLLLGCLSCEKPPTVVVYTSVDEPVARDVLKRFEVRTGIRVQVVTDTEATKTAGLAEKLLAEKDRPQADVYWGNEPFHTIRLADAGVLASYRPPTAEGIPQRYQDPEGRWYGVGFRARVIVVSSRQEHGAAVKDITGVEHLVNPTLRDRLAIANPATGTTSGHLAALYELWGEEKYRAYLLGLRANNVKLVGGNSVVAQLVGDGTLLAGLTDNDDVEAVRAAGGQAMAVIPDQGEHGIGTLLIPTTVGVVRGGPHPELSRKLADFLVERSVEEELRARRFTLGLLREIEGSDLKDMEVDFTEVARSLRTATEIALTVLQDRPTTRP